MKVNPTNAAYTYITDENKSRRLPCTYVPTTTIDAILADKSTNEKYFDLVLLDIIGYESFFLDGAKNTVFNGFRLPKVVLCSFDYWVLWQVSFNKRRVSGKKPSGLVFELFRMGYTTIFVLATARKLTNLEEISDYVSFKLISLLKKTF